MKRALTRITTILLFVAPIIGAVLVPVFLKSEITSTFEWFVAVCCGAGAGWLALFYVFLLIVLIIGIIFGLSELISKIKNN